MSKIIKLTESELIHLIKDIISESESNLIEINNKKVTDTIKRNLGVNDLSSGKYVYQPTTSREHGGKKLLIKHPQFDKNKIQTDIINLITNQSSIPWGEGTWSIKGTKLIFKK